MGVGHSLVAGGISGCEVWIVKYYGDLSSHLWTHTRLVDMFVAMVIFRVTAQGWLTC